MPEVSICSTFRFRCSDAGRSPARSESGILSLFGDWVFLSCFLERPPMANTGATGRARILRWVRDRYRWKRWGLLGPLPLLGGHEVTRMKGAIEAQRSRSGVPSTRNRHIDLPVLDTLSADADFWRPVHDVLGGELVLWRTNMFLADSPPALARGPALRSLRGRCPELLHAARHGRPAVAELHRVRAGIPPAHGGGEGTKVRDSAPPTGSPETSAMRARSRSVSGRRCRFGRARRCSSTRTCCMPPAATRGSGAAPPGNA